MKKILSKTVLTKTNNWNTTLTQSSDGEYLYFTATILWFRNYKFWKIKHFDKRISNFHKNVIEQIREIELLLN